MKWKYIRAGRSMKHHRGFELEVVKDGKWWWWSVWRPDDYYDSGKSKKRRSARTIATRKMNEHINSQL